MTKDQKSAALVDYGRRLAIANRLSHETAKDAREQFDCAWPKHCDGWTLCGFGTVRGTARKNAKPLSDDKQIKSFNDIIRAAVETIRNPRNCLEVDQPEKDSYAGDNRIVILRNPHATYQIVVAAALYRLLDGLDLYADSYLSPVIGVLMGAPVVAVMPIRPDPRDLTCGTLDGMPEADRLLYVVRSCVQDMTEHYQPRPDGHSTTTPPDARLTQWLKTYGHALDVAQLDGLRATLAPLGPLPTYLRKKDRPVAAPRSLACESAWKRAHELIAVFRKKGIARESKRAEVKAAQDAQV